jgi:hypothetical protein
MLCIGQVAGAFDELLFVLANWAWADSVLHSDNLDHLAASDRLHGNPGFELRAGGMSFDFWSETLFEAMPRPIG